MPATSPPPNQHTSEAELFFCPKIKMYRCNHYGADGRIYKYGIYTCVDMAERRAKALGFTITNLEEFKKCRA